MRKVALLVNLVAMLVMGLVLPCYAVESIDYDNSRWLRIGNKPSVYKVVIDIVTAADGSLIKEAVDSDVMDIIRGMCVERAVVIPGDSTACDAATDVDITEVMQGTDNDDTEINVFGDELDNSATQGLPKVGNAYMKRAIYEPWYIDVVGNVTECEMSVVIYVTECP